MPSIIEYRQTELIDSLELTVPQKVRGKYFSYVVRPQFKGVVYVKAPSNLTVSENANGRLGFSVRPGSGFDRFLKAVDERMKTVILENSAQFFNGRIFSRSKIDSGYIPTVGESNVLYIRVHDHTMVRDQMNSMRDTSDIHCGSDAALIFKLDGIEFTPTSMQLVLSAEQIKVYVDDRLQEWLISQDDNETVYEPNTAYSDTRSIDSTEKNVSDVPDLPPLPNQTDEEVHELTHEAPDNDDDKDLF